MPQGTNAPLAKALLQAPGVTQDSVASGQIHVRNEHANLQYRINGILLPDGVSGFSQVLDTAFIGNMALVTGALPAEYGLRTSGLVDIQARSGAFNEGGSVGLYGGSRETLTPSFEYGGTSGSTEYFVTGRYFQSNEGIENPTSSVVPIHDDTEQGSFFSYVSTLLNPDTRLSWISGSTVNHFQIPNSPGQAPVYQPFGITEFNSALLNENQFEQNYYDVIALQKKGDGVDWQLAYFARYSDLHFNPDVLGDLAFNGVASDVQRQSLVNGVQGDGSYRMNAAKHVARGLFRKRRADGRQQRVERLAGRRRYSPRCRGGQLKARLALWRLRARRMEDHRSFDAQRRPALRPDVPVRRCKPVEPPRQYRLHALCGNDVACGLCALLYAAIAGSGRPD